MAREHLRRAVVGAVVHVRLSLRHQLFIRQMQDQMLYREDVECREVVVAKGPNGSGDN